MKILVVSSVGGHLTENMQLAPILAGHEVVLVLNDDAALPDFPFARVYRIAHGGRFNLDELKGEVGIAYTLSADAGVLRSSRARYY